MPNLIALAIPFFFLLIGVELWAANRRGLRVYRFADVIADLSCGMAQQIFLVFAVAVITGGDVWVFPYRLFCFPQGSNLARVVSVFPLDFLYSLSHPPFPRVHLLFGGPAGAHPTEGYHPAGAAPP